MSIKTEIAAGLAETLLDTDGMSETVTVQPDGASEFDATAVMVLAMGDWTPGSESVPIRSRKFQDTAQMLVAQSEWTRPTLLDHVVWRSPGAAADETWRVVRIGGAFAGLWLLDLQREGYY